MIHDNCKEFQNLDKGFIKMRMRQNEHDCRETQNNMKKGPQWTERHCKNEMQNDHIQIQSHCK